MKLRFNKLNKLLRITEIFKFRVREIVNFQAKGASTEASNYPESQTAGQVFSFLSAYTGWLVYRLSIAP